MKSDKSPEERFREQIEEYQYDQTFILEGIILDLTEQVYEVMEQKGISQKQLAEAIDRDPPFISRFLSGNHNLTFSTAVRICNALDVDLEVKVKPRIPIQNAPAEAIPGESDGKIVKLKTRMKEESPARIRLTK